MNKRLIKQGTALILQGLVGPEWEQDENYEDTPKRVAEFYAAMFKPKNYACPTFEQHLDQMIILAHHIDYTMCPHHLLPVRLDISLAYIPTEAVMGLSKLVRMIMNHFTEPMLQESLTDSLADELMSRPKPEPLGAGVLIYGDHMCMRMRGVETTGSVITSAMKGVLLENPGTREEFLSLVRRK